MSTEPKPETPSSDFEDDSHDFSLDSKFRVFRIVDNARLALTLVALATGITTLGVSADSIAVYNATHVADNFLLPLWPADFNLRPTVALVAGSAVIVMANAVSIVASKTQTVRNRSGMQSSITFATAALAFAAAIVAMVWFYIVNASTTTDTFQSWTCRWRDVAMMTKPRFGTLCRQGEVGIALSVLLVPLEAVILGVAVYQTILERQLETATRGSERKTGSPALS